MAHDHEELLRAFRELRVTVIGDLMLDRYLAGRVQRISPEAPVPIVEVERTFERPGGAGNVAANTQRLGAKTTLIGLVGADPDGDRLKEVLSDAQIAVDALVTAPHLPTTVKTRVTAHGQQIVRVDRELSGAITGILADELVQASTRATADVVILSDYAKGVLTPSVCVELIRHSRKTGVPVVVDPKGRDYRRYAGAAAITPNEHEAAQAIGGDQGSALDLDHVHRFLLEELGLRAALITQGERGMSLLLPGQPRLQLPATTRDVADVTGAGDTVVSVFALGLAAGAAFADAAYVANIAAGVVVGKAGAVAISPDELLDALQPRLGARPRRPR
jgi:D-beta-D-heptose 7-phosphate kinase/D-beta-D-heptose 1-phosphate adenosyltransferase